MSVLAYSDEQLLVLATNMQRIMAALRDGTDAGDVFHTLDDWCWHVPSCDQGEECDNAVPNRAMRELAAEPEGARR